LSIFDKASGRAIRTALHEAGTQWLKSRSGPSSKAFKGAPAISDLSLKVGDGEFVALAGSDRRRQTRRPYVLVAGLEMPDSGSIRIDWRDVTRDCARPTAYVRFRLPAIFAVSASHRVREHGLCVACPDPPCAGGPISARKSRKLHVSSTSKPNSRTRQRSCRAGKCRRVAIGRALVLSPSIYLMDEPLSSSLDAKLRGEMRLELKRIQDRSRRDDPLCHP